MLLLAASFGAQAQTWSTYQSEPGRFQVEMPGTPELSSKPIAINGTDIPLYMVTVDLGSVSYLVSYIDYPSSVFANLSKEQALLNVRDGSAKGHNLLRDKEITIAGYPAREYAIARNDNTIVVLRSTIVGVRLYQFVYAVGGQTEPTSPDARRFLNSFALK
jgi:hypothetical protein